VQRAQELVAASLREWERDSSQELCPVPDEPLPPVGTLGFRVQRYGMARWGDLFTARQKAALTGLVDLLLGTECSDQERLLACSFSRVAMSNMSCTRWNAVAEKMQHTFGRQALPIVWDFAEVVVTAPGPGNWESAYRLPSDVVDAACTPEPGQVQAADATNHPLPDETAGVWFTDPPYYDAIPCSDLSDFFLVCRPRPADALVGDWAEVLRELPVRVGDWMERLQGEGIRGADLVFACIGPALEIFSRYSRVEMADGSEVGLPAYLEKVWEVVGRTALENVLGAAEAKALEQPGGAQRDLFAGTAVQASELAATRGGFRSSADDPDAGAAPEEGATTLDRVHTAMLLQAGGLTHALRNLVAAERERSSDFERLPAQVERPAAVPADSGHARHAGSVGFLGAARRLQGSPDRTAHHPRVGAAARSALRGRRARAARRAQARRCHRRGHRRRAGPRPGLDRDTKGSLRSIHRRVGAAILFESSGGQVDRRPTCRNSGSRSASRTWTRRRSTQRPWISSGAATSFAGWEAASAFTTSRRSARS